MEDAEDRVKEDSNASIMDDYWQPTHWFGQCSLSAVEAVLKGMAKKKFKYVLHHVDRAFAVFVRQDLQRVFSRSTPGSPEVSLPKPFGRWLEGWFCLPDSRFFSNLEVAAGPEMVRLVDPAVSDKEKEAILCRFLDYHHIPVQKRNFDCADVVSPSRTAMMERGAAGKHSCIRPDLRGWGNEPAASESSQSSAFACETHCRGSNGSYWTFDPTALYGQPLCWIWVGGRPDEIRAERGWISGDMDCRQTQQSPVGAERTDEPVGRVPSSVAGNVRSAADVGKENVALDIRLPWPAISLTEIALTRELLREWAVQQPREVPGMRFFLETGHRGRCVKGFCECFPPYRGPLCEHFDSGTMDDQRNFSGVLHYLTSDDPDDIEDIEHSLPRLWQRFNRRVDYPVVIFNDGLSEENRWRIVRASENRIWFAFVDDYLDVPDMLLKDPVRRAMLDEVKWSLGYRGMCRFRSGTIFLQPALKNFQYAMTLDTDGYFPADVESDPIAAMHAGSYIYTWSHLLPDLPGAVKHFWDYSLIYMRMNGIDPRGTDILRQFVREDDIQWTYQLYMNDIEIVQLDWFRSDPYQNYFRFLDSVGGFWLHRWGDHAVRTIAVGMWLPKERVYEMDIPYGHQNYCRCPAAHSNLTCVREGDVGGTPAKWWTCEYGR